MARTPPRPARATAPLSLEASGSHGRLVEAALDEFAARGFAGARVDRIAAAAGLNKAMIYYHFGNKAGLYRTTIQGLLGALAERLESATAGDATPGDKLDAFIETFVRLGLSQPRIGPLLLREIAEGATHLDRSVVGHMVRLIGVMNRIVDEGRRAGAFRDVNPLLAYLTTVWPIMVYVASSQAREQIHRHSNLDVTGFSPDHFIRHMQDVCRRTLAAEPASPRPTRAASRKREHAS